MNSEYMHVTDEHLMGKPGDYIVVKTQELYLRLQGKIAKKNINGKFVGSKIKRKITRKNK